MTDAAPSAPAIRFRGVGKSFTRRVVLADVSFDVARGEAVGLVGVNGAGKTTLLRALLDLARPDAGSIEVFGVSATAPAARAHLSYLAERFNPPGFATGLELLRYLLALHGLELDRAQAEAEARALDLEPSALARLARHYSKGMAQKLGLMACILAHRPLLVLDEPMSGLDPRARVLFKRCLAAQKARGATLFFSTHLLADVEALCDRIAVLDGGRVVFAGTPAALLAREGVETLEDAFLSATAAPASSDRTVGR